jgi:hypothetical protein
MVDDCPELETYFWSENVETTTLPEWYIYLIFTSHLMNIELLILKSLRNLIYGIYSYYGKIRVPAVKCYTLEVAQCDHKDFTIWFI